MKHIDQMRRDFDLSEAQFTMNSLEHQITMLRIDLVNEYRRPGGGKDTFLAQELEAKIRAIEAEWKVAVEKVRALKAEKFANKPPAQPRKTLIDWVLGGPYVPRSHG
jgi:hypothetical protein